MAGFGVFGKLPALGDFVQFGLPRDFTDPWDRWLQASLPAAREALGERWRDGYFTAPIWRFSLAAGLAGAQRMAGVLMPSVDRVGRQYPLTIAGPSPAGADLLHQHLALDATFAALEQIALAALEDGVTAAGLADALAALPPPPRPPAPVLREAAGRLTLVATAGGIAAALAAPRPAAASVWSSHVGACDRLMILGALPDTMEVCGLFDLAAPVWGEASAEGRG